MEMKFKVLRFDPQKGQEPAFQEYTVDAKPSDRILDCLNRIKWEQDDSLVFRASCAHGVCGSDAMKINGKCGLACQMLVKDFEGPDITLEPPAHFQGDQGPHRGCNPVFAEGARDAALSANPGAPPPKPSACRTRPTPKNSPRPSAVFFALLAWGACPVSNENPEFLGPAPLVWAFRLVFDSRDQKTKERLQAIDHPNGAWACENHFECTRVCPKEIKVTKHINMLKREIEKQLGSKGA